MKNIIDKKFFSELIGTYILASIVLITLIPSIPFPIATPIAAALTLGLCVYMFGNISGCHLNPAISFSMLLLKQISVLTLLKYWFAQIIGGLVAYIMINLYVPVGKEAWLITNHTASFSGIGELLGSAFFSFGVFSTIYIKINKNIVGIIVAVSLLIGITISHNASYGVLNPVIALATKAWSLDYLLMPFFGALIGSFVSKLLFDHIDTLETSS
ncbi:aquaporin [Piscirickettsia salmonis]|uniref:aquaporin n=1 Tax=Piscirickettsia salmonis TaxID=1238 RepID=UPI0007C8A06B|nr:aquaporin Z [Piscirickettsiaceae bacterium NZ-RLO1]